MRNIHMNEWNEVAFSKKWEEVKSFLKENKIPYVQKGQLLSIIMPFPTAFFKILEDVTYGCIHSEDSEWCLFEIHNEQFKLTKEEQWAKERE